MIRLAGNRFRRFLLIVIAASLFFVQTPLQTNADPGEQITTSVDIGLVSFHSHNYQSHVIQPFNQLIYFLFDKSAVTLNLLILVGFLPYWRSRYYILLKHRLLRPLKFTSIFVDNSPRM